MHAGAQQGNSSPSHEGAILDGRNRLIACHLADVLAETALAELRYDGAKIIARNLKEKGGKSRNG